MVSCSVVNLVDVLGLSAGGEISDGAMVMRMCFEK